MKKIAEKWNEARARAATQVRHGEGFWGGVMLFLRYARGDWMTKSGKAVACVTFGAVLLAVNLATITPGQTFNGFGFIGLVLVAAFWLSVWINFEPSGCAGPRKLYASPSEDVALSLCHGCQTWAVFVRKDLKGTGLGVDALGKKLRRLVETHARNAGDVAAELLAVAEVVESMKDLRDEDALDAPGGPLATQNPPEEAFPGWPPGVAQMLNELGAVPISWNDLKPEDDATGGDKPDEDEPVAVATDEDQEGKDAS